MNPFGKIRKCGLFFCLSSAAFCFLFSLPKAYGGKILSNQQTESGWHFKIEGYEADVTLIDENIFRIKTTPAGFNGIEKENTFIAPRVQSKKPLRTRLKLEDQLSFILKSKTCQLKILKEDFKISLICNGNRILSGGSMTLNKKEKSPLWELKFNGLSGERNYGIGNPALGKSGGLLRSASETGMEGGVSKIPFLISSSGYGLFIHYEDGGMSWRRKEGSHTLAIPGEVLDFYIIAGDTPYKLLNSYADLTGKPPIPPLWAFGFMMSRWGYAGWDDVKNKWETFREKKIPVDVFIYDYDWFEKDWQWNYKTFPSPKENMALVREKGIKVVGIRKPRCDDKENLSFIKDKNWILPNTPSDFNLFLPEVREWWWEKNIHFVKDGIAGWWNDEAEHSYLEYYYMVEAQWKGMRELNPQERVWTINRAFTPGLQRLGAAVWTGDVDSTWEALENQPGTFLNYGITGMPYSSSDIGGFKGNPSGELFARWIQLGVFTPVMRAHGTLNSDRWPWAFGPEIEASVKKAIELRYRLIPYLYSYARQSYLTGAPINRPLFFDFKDDPQTFDMEDEWLVGREIVVASVLNPDGKREVYLPNAGWYDFNSGKFIRGPVSFRKQAAIDEIPIYVREGSIIPLGPIMQHTGEKKEIPVEINVYAGRNGSFSLYMDDGETYDYEKGGYSETALKWDDGNCILTIDKPSRNYAGPKKYLLNKINIYGIEKPSGILLDGIPLKISRYDESSHLLQIESGILDADMKHLLKVSSRKKRTMPGNSEVDEEGVDRLMKETVLGNQKAIDELAEKISAFDSNKKCRALNLLSPNLNNRKVYEAVNKLAGEEDIFVQKRILKIIKGYAPGKEYIQVLSKLLKSKNGEVAAECREIINFLYPEESARYLLSGVENMDFKGEKVLASSSQEGKSEGRYAFDGKMDTRWASEFSDPQWIIVDLENIKTVKRIALFWEAAYAKEYRLLISSDKRIWKTVYSEENGDGGTDIINFEPAKARYLAVYGIKRATQWGYSLWELKINE